MREPKTIVVFRRWRGEDHSVLALFPHEEAKPGYCASYAHIGQHSAADYAGCIRRTRPANHTDADVMALKRELQNIGYVLDVRQRKGSKP